MIGQAENDGDQRYILVPGVEHRQAQRAQRCQQRQLAQNVPGCLHGRIFQSVPKAGLFAGCGCGTHDFTFHIYVCILCSGFVASQYGCVGRQMVSAPSVQAERNLLTPP